MDISVSKPEIIETSFNTPFNADIFNESDANEINLNVSSIIVQELENKDIFDQLPPNFKELLLKHRGINRLFDWQEKILKLNCIYNASNLIYSCPTGGGKTLISELILIREVLTNKKNALYIVPYVSLAHEKVSSLSPFGFTLGFHIEEYASSKGAIPPRKRYKRKSIYVATIEKASLLINSLIDENRLDTIGAVVVDEIHMINEPKRGIVLEILLTKLIYYKCKIQIVGMSATLKNVQELCQFLSATYFSSTQRPVALKEYLCLGSDFFMINSADENWKSKMVFQKSLHKIKTQPSQHLSMLVNFVEELEQSQPCLIFCPTKKNCEVVCENLLKNIKPFICKTEERKELLKALEYVNGGVCSILRCSVPRGIAYHHAGMSDDERKMIEEAYLCGTINILCCTSTLAAGVNLPAYRVIIKTPKIGTGYLTNIYYRQMIGRAGRPGLSEHGESILMIDRSEKHILDDLFKNDQICLSALSIIDEEELATLIVFLFQSNTKIEKSTLTDFFKNTLWYIQLKNTEETNLFLEKFDKSLNILLERKFIKVEGESYELTCIGKGINKSGIEIKEFNNIYNSLKISMNNFCLSTDLHLIYLCIPLDSNIQFKGFQDLLRLISSLNQSELDLLNATGMSESLIYKYSYMGNEKNITPELKFIFNRWLNTLIFYQLYKGRSIWSISTEFEISRGLIQYLITSTISNAHTLSRFTKELVECWQIHLLLEEMVKKISMIHCFDVLPLLEITGVKLARAKQLHKAGYKTVEDVANTSAKELIQNISHLSRRQANSIISSAKLLVREMVEKLRDEADEIINKCKNINLE